MSVYDVISIVWPFIVGIGAIALIFDGIPR